DLRPPGQNGVQVHFMKHDPGVVNILARQDFQPFKQGVGLRAAMGLDIPGHHVTTVLLAPPGRLQHGIGLPHPGSVAQEYLQFPQLRRSLFGLRQLEHRLRRGACFVAIGHGFSLSSSRFNTSTFTRGSPKNPSWRSSVACSTAFITTFSDKLRALATRGTCSRADSGVTCGSSPLAEACTRSAGTGPVTPVSRSALTRSPTVFR